MTGRVMRSTGSWYTVLTEDGTLRYCRVRGKLRLADSRESNPVAVGDRVRLTVDAEDATIVEVLDRTNHIVRQSARKAGHSHVIAANVDQAMLLATIAHPRTSTGFIDRFLVTCEAYGIPQVLVMNKQDLLSEDDLELAHAILDLYGGLGVTTFLVSLKDDIGVAALEQQLAGKTTLITGHSGTGKSTLLNRFLPDARQSVGEISSFSEKGVHTTTFAEMFRIGTDTFVIDTPGIKEWGLLDMKPQEISDYFPEMRDLRLSCRFGSRCLHIHEPGCAVLNAVEEGAVSASRYHNYLSMVSGDDNRK
ncbi:MAG: ribosome small subunit-dependent GTPase A [Bacteroidota bacterium]